MINLELQFHPFLLQSTEILLERIRSDLLDQKESGGIPPADDPEMADYWSSELREALRADMKVLSALVRQFRNAGTDIRISEENAWAAIRASVSFRLRIRTIFLNRLSDDVLETGDLGFAELEQEEKRPYASYLFLGAVQEHLISLLDPESSELQE